MDYKSEARVRAEFFTELRRIEYEMRRNGYKLGDLAWHFFHNVSRYREAILCETMLDALYTSFSWQHSQESFAFWKAVHRTASLPPRSDEPLLVGAKVATVHGVGYVTEIDPPDDEGRVRVHITEPFADVAADGILDRLGADLYYFKKEIRLR